MSEDEASIYEVETLYRYCRRCHRKLKNEKSMRIGYGSVCAKKVNDL